MRIRIMDKMIEYGIYKICLALVAIVNIENCYYGFEDEVDAAEEYIRDYEKDHIIDE